jgi:hypothetical protein
LYSGLGWPHSWPGCDVINHLRMFQNCLGTVLTNWDEVHVKIKKIMKSVDACFYLVWKLIAPSAFLNAVDQVIQIINFVTYFVKHGFIIWCKNTNFKCLKTKCSAKYLHMIMLKQMNSFGYYITRNSDLCRSPSIIMIANSDRLGMWLEEWYKECLHMRSDHKYPGQIFLKRGTTDSIEVITMQDTW